MMQMLQAGGIELLTDHRRAADPDNPRGYFEFERAKRIASDTSWLPAARGKCVKIVSQLLYHLPVAERYRVVLMRRDLEEMITSQEKMLRRREQTPPPRERIRQAYIVHLEQLFAWLKMQAHMRVLHVDYNELLKSPRGIVSEVQDFLDGRPKFDAMFEVIEPALYRNRLLDAGHRTAAETPCPHARAPVDDPRRD
jgi:hypothetical protein